MGKGAKRQGKGEIRLERIRKSENGKSVERKGGKNRIRKVSLNVEGDLNRE